MSDAVVRNERAALGAALHSEQALEVVLSRLSMEDLLSDEHRRILGAMQRLHGRGQGVDPVTLLDEMNGQGPSDLANYYVDVPSAKNASAYVDAVKREARRRKLTQSLEGFVSQLKSGVDPATVDAQVARLGAEVGGASSDRSVDGAAFVLDVPDEIPPVWGTGADIAWSQGEPLYIVGPPGVGKTTVTQQLVLARIGLGDPEFLGMDVVPDDRRVLYVASDRPAQAARSMRRMVDESNRSALKDRLVAWRGPLPFDIGSEPHRLTLMARHYQAGTVVLDSLKDVAMDIVKDDVGARVNHALQALVADGVEVVILHHQRKSTGQNTKPNSLDDVYGSRWLTAGAGSVLLLWGTAGDPIVELQHLKQPSGEVGPVRLIHDHVAGRTRLYDSVNLLDIIRSVPKGITSTDAARHLFGTMEPDASQREKARRKLEGLRSRGLAHRKDGSPGGQGGSTPNLYFAVEARREEPPV